jgi:RNA polymerase sigma-70 factor (ECF subfamily)
VSASKDEAQWVLRAQCGDREALELVLAAIQAPLLRYARSLVGAEHAEDVLQDALIIVARKLTWLDDPELVRPWAYRIASRVAFRHLKQQRRWSEQRGEPLIEDTIAAPEVSREDVLHDLLSAEGISPASRAVLMLHFQEEMTLPEVAAILEIPLGTAKSRLAYGLAAIRRQLGSDRRR